MGNAWTIISSWFILLVPHMALMFPGHNKHVHPLIILWTFLQLDAQFSGIFLVDVSLHARVPLEFDTQL